MGKLEVGRMYFVASEKKFPKEKAMKFHDNMHVRLRNGVEIIGLPFLGGRPQLHNFGYWYDDGSYSANGENPYDIVEVLSKPPRLKVKDMELKVGMQLQLMTSYDTPFQFPVEVIAINRNMVWCHNSLKGDFFETLTELADCTLWEDNNG